MSPRCTLLVFVGLLVLPLPAVALRYPVDGEISKPFAVDVDSYFGAGQHRGVDIAADIGSQVRASCSGVVHFVGNVAGTPVVSQDCGRYRVSYLPVVAQLGHKRLLSTGTTIGKLAASSDHAGLHLGVREISSGEYVDPAALLQRESTPIIAPSLLPRRRFKPAPDRWQPRQHPATQPQPAPVYVWIGLGVALFAFVGGGTLVFGVRRRVCKPVLGRTLLQPGRSR